MKFLLATITLVIVFAMNRFHEDHFKDANIFFKEIVYKNTTEVFHVETEIRKLIEAFKERQKNRTRSQNEIEKNRTRSLNEIECTKIFYEYIKDDDLSEAWNTKDLKISDPRIFKEIKISRKFQNEMKNKLKPYLKTRAIMAFGENSLCKNSFMKVTFSTTSLPPVGYLPFLSSKIGRLLDFFNLNPQKLLGIQFRLTLGEVFNTKPIKIAYTTRWRLFTTPDYLGLTNEDFPKLEILNVEIRLTLRKTKEDETDNNLKITKDEQNWEFTGTHFLNTLYVLILIFVFKTRFHVIIDFNCQNNDGKPILVRFQIIRIH